MLFSALNFKNLLIINFILVFICCIVFRSSKKDSLKSLKAKNTIIIPEIHKILHSLIIELSSENREQELQKIFRKYSDRVNIDKDRDYLSKDVIWTAREVSILLFEVLKNK